MRKILVGFIAACLIVACGNKDKETERTGFRIKGKIINNRGNQALNLQELTNTGLITIDTSSVNSDGTFELNGTLKEKTFCVLRLNAGDLVMVIDTNSDLELEFPIDSIQNYIVKGSKENEELKTLFGINNSFMKSVQSLEAKYAQYGESVPPLKIQERIRSEYDSLRIANQLNVKNYAGSLTHSIVPYFAANFLTPEVDFNFFDQVDQQLYKEFSSSKYAIQLHQKVEELRRTADGNMAPDILLNDPFGKNISLSSLRGKVILVDFWASWCKPCRDENPNVVKLYNKYKAKGFDVFGVSLDDNREAWMAAINKDQLLWNHGSDLLKWNSSVVKLYNIEGIPFTVLVDKDGKVIAKRLRGESLENKLKEIFGF